MRLDAKIVIGGFNMLIKRDEYLNKLISKNEMIKVIAGIKRCGKSYLLFKLFKIFFYIFYPLHFLVLGIINLFL